MRYIHQNSATDITLWAKQADAGLVGACNGVISQQERRVWGERYVDKDAGPLNEGALRGEFISHLGELLQGLVER